MGRLLAGIDLGHIADHLSGLDLPGDPLVCSSLFGVIVAALTAT